jgi:hypothetical protein
MGVWADAQQDNVQPWDYARFVRTVIGHVGSMFGLGGLPKPAGVVLRGLLRSVKII